MLTSKRVQNILALLVASVALTGCWKPSEKPSPIYGDETRDGSFYVSDVSAHSTLSRDNVTLWKVPEYREFFFTACLVDRHDSAPVRGHKFSVYDPAAKQSFPGLVSNYKGCVQWQENIKYDYFAIRPTYVEVERIIKGEGVHSGGRSVKLAINPWACDRDDDCKREVVYLKNEQVSISQIVRGVDVKEALSKGLQTGRKAKLWIQDVKPLVSIQDEVKEIYDDRKNEKVEVVQGVALGINMKMRAKVELENLAGRPHFMHLEAGQFQIYAQLLAAGVGPNRNQRLILTPNKRPGFGKIIDGNLESFVQATMTRDVKRARLEMALKVVPVGLNIPIEDFEAVFNLGDLDAGVLGGHSPQLLSDYYTPGKQFSFKGYLEEAANFEELKKLELARDLTPFMFDIASIMFTGIQPGETATRRTIEYQVTMPVRDRLTGAPARFQTFEIYDESGKRLQYKRADGTVADPMTNQQGQLTWTSTIEHKYYKPEEYRFVKFKIVYPRTGATEVREILLNPWDAMYRTFGWDRGQVTQDFIDKLKTREKIPSRLAILTYAYHTIRFSYEIDRFMNLEVKKEILLSLSPEVLRYSGIIGGRKVTEDLRDGIYLMKVAIQKDYLDPAAPNMAYSRGEVITVTDKKTGRKEIIPANQLSQPDKQKRNIQGQARHFVTVEKKLVRVNAGYIKTPVALSMRDLRLMRVRSQFLVQLEPVDERLLQAANILHQESMKDLREMESKRQLTHEEKLAFRQKRRGELEGVLHKLRERDQLYKQDWRLRENEVFGLKSGRLDALNESIENALRKNDFTVTEAAPIVDLDTLVEKDSGLGRRTFVGPIIFLSNAYGDDLRATDNLDLSICETSDCGQIKSREAEMKDFENVYETSPYFGSYNNLINKQVDDLIEEHRTIENDYQRFMSQAALISNFTDYYNLTYVSLTDQPLKRVREGCQSALHETCLVDSNEGAMTLSEFMRSMDDEKGTAGYLKNGYAKVLRFVDKVWQITETNRPVTLEDLQNLVEKGHIPTWLGERFCRSIASNINVTSPRMNAVQFSDVRSRLYGDCLGMVMRGGSKYAFVTDRKLRVIKPARYGFLGGKQMNLNVGANFTLNQSESMSFGVSGNLAELTVIGGVFGKVASRLGSVIGLGLKPLSIKFGRDYSRSKANGTSFNEQTYLVMQTASFDLELVEYEPCVAVKLSPAMLKNAGEAWSALAPDEATRDEIGRQMHKGYFICGGRESNKPRNIRETYFYFTQHFTEGDMLDQADLYNHPWLLALRGVRDFRTFVRLMRAQELRLSNMMTPVVDEPGWPLEQMVGAYLTVPEKLPSFPGLYTVLDEDEPLKDYPFTHDPTHAFTE